jgi:hypothetical protein
MFTPNESGCHQPRRRRAPATGRRLTEATATQAKGMLLRGDAVQSVSNFFGVNSARMYAIDDDFPNTTAAAPELLPPPGPYLPPCSIAEVDAALTSARRAIDLCATLLSGSQGTRPH